MMDPNYVYETNHADKIAYIFSHQNGDWYFWDIDGFDEDEDYSFMKNETGYYSGIGMHAYLEFPKPIEKISSLIFTLISMR